ncbi:pyridoxamine 5'-phosphate oxidase family protein [Amorphoplanes nipponensis]|uniref:Pyridoxamine 5'-phosphate oxidase n=1 Tax=Actinoplanes nipponensis TaxID=135950 RepID=A0A919JNG0_9ACTN|nr:pyridoxamine 5'-phosphate oxidase family protein [Actinoplanes nipponensis]GIE53846.1 hypothetical protein Ani05nite_73800 [Actinoplanes nipponensis]
MSVSTPAGAAQRPAAAGPQLTADQIWRAVTKASFAVLGHVTPAGAPRSSGVVYCTAGPRMYVAVARDSWKARHVAAHGEVAVTVTVRRGGLLALLFPIPPATISFAARAVVHPAGTLLQSPELAGLARLVPPGRREACAIIEITPVGHYVTYGLGVPLLRMRDTVRARARVRV